MIVAGAGAAAVLCLLPWWSVSVSGEFAKAFSGLGASGNALSTTSGTIFFVFALIAVAAPFVESQGMVSIPAHTAALIPLAAAAVALLCGVIFFASGPGPSGGAMNLVSVSRSFWFYLALLAMGFAGFRAFKRWQALQQQPAA